jgi:Sap, sulfolipid-1-addressing protein
MLSILPLAFAAAVYPTLLAGVIVMLSRPAPRPLLIGFLLGGLLVSVTSGVIIVFVVHGAVSLSRQNSASPKIDLIAGILSLILAVVLWTRRDVGPLGRRKTHAGERANNGEHHGRTSRRSHQSITNRMLSHGSPKAAFSLGLILNLPGIWYLVALKDIAKANDGAVAAVLLILLFNAIMFLLVEVPLIGYLVSPEGTKKRVERFHAWLGANVPLVATGAALAIGLYLVTEAIVHLS